MIDYNQLMSSALSIQSTLEMMEARFAELEDGDMRFADKLQRVKSFNQSHLDDLRSYKARNQLP